MNEAGKEAALLAVRSNVGLDEKIKEARENLSRILMKFNGSENHKQIRTLRRRILRKLLNERALGIRAELRSNV